MLLLGATVTLWSNILNMIVVHAKYNTLYHRKPPLYLVGGRIYFIKEQINKTASIKIYVTYTFIAPFATF